MSLTDLRSIGDMAIEYFKDRQAKGYSQADVIKEILASSEGETFNSVKSWVQRTAKKMNIKFINGNEKRKAKSTTATAQQKQSIEQCTQYIPQTKEPEEVNITEDNIEGTQDIPQAKEATVATEESITQDIPQAESQQENQLYLELLERVEKLEQQLSSRPANQPFEGMYINSGIRVHKDTWKEFNEFCSTAKESKQLLITKALHEYMQNHK